VLRVVVVVVERGKERGERKEEGGCKKIPESEKD
jgi:hypothetical protein